MQKFLCNKFYFYFEKYLYAFRGLKSFSVSSDISTASLLIFSLTLAEDKCMRVNHSKKPYQDLPENTPGILMN